MIRTLGRLLAIATLLLSHCEPAFAASTTPPNLTPATSVANGDLMLVWDTADVGPLKALPWSTLKAQLTTDLTGFLKTTNNLSDLGNAGTARTNLGVTSTGLDTTYAYRANNLSDLASASTARTNLGLPIGTSGAVVCLANTACTWATTQTFTVAPVFTAASATRTALGLAIGTNVEAWSASLDALAALSTTGKIYYLSAANTWTAVIIGSNLTFSGGTLAATGGGCSGSCTFTGSNNLGSANSNVQTFQGNIVATGGTPGGTCTSVSGTSSHGTASMGAVNNCSLTFSTAYASAPDCTISGDGAGAASITFWVGSVTTNALVVKQSGSSAVTFHYICIG